MGSSGCAGHSPSTTSSWEDAIAYARTSASVERCRTRVRLSRLLQARKHEQGLVAPLARSATAPRSVLASTVS